MKKIILGILLYISVISNAQPNLSLGLVANYSFSGNAFDSGPNAANGTYTGIGTGLANDRNNTPNEAYSFDGVNFNYINIGNRTELKSLGRTFSISVWVNILGDGINLAPIFLSGAGLSSFSLIKAAGSDDRIVFKPGIDSNNPLSGEIKTTSALQRNRWYHIVAIYNGFQTKLYIDGFLNNTVNVPLVVQNNDVLVNARTVNIGAESAAHSSNNTASAFHGMVDELKIYNRELTDCEVFTLFDTNLPCETCLNFSESNTIAYFPFCKNTNDASTNAFQTVSLFGVNYAPDFESNLYSALNFSGSNSRVDYGNIINLGTSSFSVSLYLKSSLTGVNQTIISKGDGDCSNSGFAIKINSLGYLSLGMGGYLCNNGFLIYGKSKQTINDGNWHNIVISIDRTNSKVKLFVDGTQLFLYNQSNNNAIGLEFDLSSFGSLSASITKNFTIGANSIIEEFKGSLDEIKIKNTVLTDCNAIQLNNPNDNCTNCLFNFDASLISYYPFCKNYYDQSGNSNHPVFEISTNFTTGKDGNSVSGLNFIGSSAGINFGSKNNTGTGSFSVSVWFKTTLSGVSGIGQTLLAKGFETNCLPGYILGINYGQNGSINFGMGTGVCSNSFLIQTTSTGYNDGNWHNAVAIVDRTANTVKIYVDGTIQSISNVNSSLYNGGVYNTNYLNISGLNYNINNTLGYNIGARNSSLTSEVFNGQMDEIKTYNRILSECEALKQFDKDGVCITPTCTTNGDPGVVAYYPFCGDATDASGNGHHAQIPVNGNISLTTDRFGNENSAYLFPGGQFDYMEVAHHPSLNFPNSSFSISVWAYRTSTTFNAMMVNKGGDIQDGYSLRVNGDGQGAARFRLGQPNDLIGDYDITNNVWTNYTSTFDRPTSTMSLYEDGILIGQRQLSAPYTIGSTNPLVFGQHSCCQGASNFRYHFEGKLDDIILYTRAITGCEAYKIASGGTSCPGINDGMIANYEFCSSPNDNSVTGNNLTSFTGTYIIDRFGSTYSAVSNPKGKVVGSNNANFDIGTKSVVISTWFKTSNTTGNQRFMSNGNQTGADNGYFFGINHLVSGGISFGLGANGNANESVFISTANSFADGNWHMATAVANTDAKIVNIYIDGVKQNIIKLANSGGTIVGQDLFIKGLNNLNASSPEDFCIGQYTDGSESYKGLMDDARIYNRILVRGEVKKIFFLPSTQQICCPTLATVTAQNLSICGPGFVTITATGSFATYRWYNQALGGSILGVNSSFTTTSLIATSVFYVSMFANGCGEGVRTPVTVTVLNIPTIPFVPYTSICGIQNHTLTGTATGIINWFTTSTTSAAIGTGNQIIIPNLSTSGFYFAQNLDYGCQSPRTETFVTILPKPTIPGIIGTKSVCPNAGAIGYNVTSILGDNYQWFVSFGTVSGIVGDSITVSWGNSTTGAKLKVIGTNPQACNSDTSIVSIIIKEELATETPNGITSICSAFAKNLSYQITPTNGSTYVWFASNSSITSNFGYGITISPTISGKVEVYVIENVTTTSSICRGVSTILSIDINPSPDSTQSIIGKPEQCQKTSFGTYSILGFANSRFVWNYNNFATSSGSNLYQPSTSISGITTLTVSEITDKNCSYRGVSKQILIHPKPTTVGIFSNAIYCRSNYVNAIFSVSGFQNSSFFWYENNGIKTQSGQNLTAITTTLDSTQNTEFLEYKALETSVFGCVGDTISKKHILSLPLADVKNVSTNAEDETKITVDFTKKAAIFDSLYLIRNPTTSSKLSLENNSFVDASVNTSTTIYSYQLNAVDFCKINRPSVIHQSVLLKGFVNTTTGEVNLSWNPYKGWLKGVSNYEILRDLGSNAFESFGNTNDTLFIKEAANDGTTQRFRIKAIANSSNFVSYSNSISLNFDKNPIIYTAFTPNTSDNLNSTWIIDRLNLYPNNKVTIQDKWGNIVYQQSNYHLNPWDGTYNGKNAPEGMYYFVLELNQQNKPITGTINIIR